MKFHSGHEYAEATEIESGQAWWPGLERYAEPMPGRRPLAKADPLPGLRLDGIAWTYLRDELRVPVDVIALGFDVEEIDVLRAVQTTRAIIRRNFGAHACPSPFSRPTTQSAPSDSTPSSGTTWRGTAPLPPRRNRARGLYLRYVLAMFLIDHGGFSEGQIARLLRRCPGQVNRAVAQARTRFKTYFEVIRYA